MEFTDNELRNEEWKRVSLTNDYYIVSNKGRVVRIYDNRCFILKQSDDGNGYPYVCIYINGKPKTRRVHRLVAEEFLNKETNRNVVNHIDGNKNNNTVENLEWVTSRENLEHAWENNLNTASKPKPVIRSDYTLYESASKAAFELGIDASAITKCCRGKLNTCGGYGWRYA